MDVTLEEAYKEACLALGEAMVRERLLTRALAAQGEQQETVNTKV